MKLQIFDLSDHISIIIFLSGSNLGCDANGVHEGAAFWLLYFFMEHLAVAALSACIAIRSKLHKRQEGGLVTSSCEVVNYLLETYSTDDVIAETDAHMMHLTQPSSKCPTEYSEALRNMALLWDRVYNNMNSRECF